MASWTPMKRKIGGKQHPEVPIDEKINAGEYNVGAYNLDTLKKYLEQVTERKIKAIEKLNENNEKILERYKLKTIVPRPIYPRNSSDTVATWVSAGFGAASKRTISTDSLVWAGKRYVVDNQEVNPPFWDVTSKDKDVSLPVAIINKNGGKVRITYLYRTQDIISVALVDNSDTNLFFHILHAKYPIADFTEKTTALYEGNGAHYSALYLDDNNLPTGSVPYGFVYATTEKFTIDNKMYSSVYYNPFFVRNGSGINDQISGQTIWANWFVPN